MRSITEIIDAHLALNPLSAPASQFAAGILVELEAREAAIVTALRGHLKADEHSNDYANHLLRVIGLPSYDTEPPVCQSHSHAGLRTDVDRDRQAVVQAYELLMPVAERLGVFLPGVPRVADDEPDVPLGIQDRVDVSEAGHTLTNGLSSDLHYPDCAGMDDDGNWVGPCTCLALYKAAQRQPHPSGPMIHRTPPTD